MGGLSSAATPTTLLRPAFRQPAHTATTDSPWTRRESTPTPKAGFCGLGATRKLATQQTSFRSAAVMATPSEPGTLVARRGGNREGEGP